MTQFYTFVLILVVLITVVDVSIAVWITYGKQIESESVYQSSKFSHLKRNHVRRRRETEDPVFIPIDVFYENNDAPSPLYPRQNPDVDVDTTSMYASSGIPDTPQKVRLRGEKGNMNPNEGRVEVRYKKLWGLACDDYFQKPEGDVFCHQLGFNKGSIKTYRNSFFGVGSFKRWDILIGNLNCQNRGDEKSLFDCNYKLMPPCELTGTAGVECSYNEGCEWGWSAFDGLCYRVEISPKDVKEASAVCQSKGAKLAYINSLEENNYITNMLYTKFKKLNAVWTGGQYGVFKDFNVFTYNAWTFKNTIHLIKQNTTLWFPGFDRSGKDKRPEEDLKKKSCIALSKIFYKDSSRTDVDVNYFWWDNASCKTKLPFICQKLATKTSDCYENNGMNYEGTAKRTDKGSPCEPWDQNTLINDQRYPGKGLKGNNYCRNPDGDAKPWCWVDNKRYIFGYCNLKNCKDSNPIDDKPTVPKDLKPEFGGSYCDSDKNQFFCPSMINYRPTCIAKHYVCDGLNDCVGKEDEDATFCKKYKCSDSQFYCNKTHVCLSQIRVCDGYVDCEYGDDESPEACKTIKEDVNVMKDYTKYPNINESSVSPSTKTTLYVSLSLSQCKNHCDRSSQFVCAGFLYSLDPGTSFKGKCTLLSAAIPESERKPENTASSSYYEYKKECNQESNFKCNNGKCVLKTETCNGYDNCGDFSDEIKDLDQCSKKPEDNFKVKLSGGSANNEGRVEVQLFNDVGLLCDDGIGANEATVICKQLGFANGYESIIKNAVNRFGRGNGVFLMTNVTCAVNATNLFNCRHNGWKNTSCGINDVLGLVCLTDRACTPNEYKCMNRRCVDISKICDGKKDCSDGDDEEDCANMKLNLRRGTNSSSGILEIERGGVRGTICDDMFGDNEVKVACKQLGILGRGVKVPKDTFKTPAGTVVWLKDIKCTGNEDSLFQCLVSNWGRTHCDISESVGIVCGLADAVTTQAPTTAPITKPKDVFECGKRLIDPPAGRIINGYPAVSGQFPWQVGVRVRSSTYSSAWCGGTILNDRWILCASHCFSDYPKSSYIVRVGDMNNVVKDEYEREFEIDLLLLHPKYTGLPAYDYDMTLIRIKPDSQGYIKFNYGVQPACLPDKNLIAPASTVCHISGWGKIGTGVDISNYPKNLMAADVPLIDNERCNGMYRGAITDRMQCAGYESGGIDSCQGDSGGPLVCKINGIYTVLGATSWGFGCALPNSPGVYANVRYLRDWIDQTMMENP